MVRRLPSVFPSESVAYPLTTTRVFSTVSVPGPGRAFRAQPQRARSVFHVDAARLLRLTAAGDSDGIGAELAARVLARITGGRGGELLTRWPAGPDWTTAVLGPPDRYQLGGSGPQASWAPATVGAPSVLALGDRSAEQLAVIDPRTGFARMVRWWQPGLWPAPAPRRSCRTASWSSRREPSAARSPSPDRAGSSCGSATNRSSATKSSSTWPQRWRQALGRPSCQG